MIQPDKGRTAPAVGRRITTAGTIVPQVAERLGATLMPDWAPGKLEPGTVLPPLWHWAAFAPIAAMRDLGPDGHPRLGTFLPDLGLNRRMWASGALRFHKPLHVDEPLRQDSEIATVEHKTGPAGDMAFVTVRHRISGTDGLAVEEDQTLVYLNIPDSYRPPKPVPAPTGAAFDTLHPVTPTLLFRYSAITFNGHRIHYDRAYATDVERYPALVVHGPMQATLLAAAATAHRGAPPTSFRYRGVHPMFDTHDLRVIGVEDGATLTLCTAAPQDVGGHQGMQATAEWAT